MITVPDPMETTQPAHQAGKATDSRFYTLVVFAVVLGAAVTAALHWAEQLESEREAARWQAAATHRASAIAHSLRQTMANGRPELGTTILESHPDVTIVQPSGERAFITDEYSTYLANLKTACRTNSPTATRWIAGTSDPRLHSAGTSPCNAVFEGRTPVLQPNLPSEPHTWPGDSPRV